MSERDSADIAVIGGGVAGIVAALRCADAGAKVSLLEVRPRLGGAAYSVQREGLTIDNGQHVFLRCCSTYRELLRRLGSERLVAVQPRLEIPVLRAGGTTTVLRRSNLPAPAHLARAMLSFSLLSPRRRLSAAAAVRALAAIDPQDPANDRVTFGHWLARRGQDDEAVASLWDLVVLPTLNVRAQEASLALGAFVFQKGLLTSTDGGDIGFHRGTLSSIIGEPALQTLRAARVDVRLRWRVRQVLSRRPADGAHGDSSGADHAEGLAPAGERRAFEIQGVYGQTERRLQCDAAIVALPHTRTAEVLPPQTGQLGERLRSIGVSPIVNLHVLYDRQVCELPFAAGVHSPVQYIFDRSEAGGAPAGHQYLAVSLSGADAEMKMSVEALRARYVPALADLLPAAQGAEVKRFLVTREHAATFRAVPGVGALRPAARTSVQGLALAGAYTDTGWPATLEGAALSGNAAAEAVLADLGAKVPAPAPAPAPALGGAR